MFQATFGVMRHDSIYGAEFRYCVCVTNTTMKSDDTTWAGAARSNLGFIISLLLNYFLSLCIQKHFDIAKIFANPTFSFKSWVPEDRRVVSITTLRRALLSSCVPVFVRDKVWWSQPMMCSGVSQDCLAFTVLGLKLQDSQFSFLLTPFFHASQAYTCR